MTTANAAEPELVAMLQRIGGKPRPIPRTAAIYHDLQIGGDDAYELLEMVAKRFDISFSGLDWAKYFPNETEMGPITYWSLKLGFRDTKHRRITVGHLLDVIERGAWFEPDHSN